MVIVLSSFLLLSAGIAVPCCSSIVVVCLFARSAPHSFRSAG